MLFRRFIYFSFQPELTTDNVTRFRIGIIVIHAAE